jgi:hypothetical protein
MSNFLIVQEWLRYLSSQPWAIALGAVAAFWVVMQLLPNTWAGGSLFERKFAWVSSAIASVVVFLVFVVPNVTWEFFLSLVGVAFLGLCAWLLKKYVK